MLQIVCCIITFFLLISISLFFFFSILQLVQIRGAQYRCYVSMKIIEILSRAKIIIRFLPVFNVSFFAESQNCGIQEGSSEQTRNYIQKQTVLRVVVKTISEEEKQNKTLCVCFVLFWGPDGARLPVGAARSLRAADEQHNNNNDGPESALAEKICCSMRRTENGSNISE